MQKTFILYLLCCLSCFYSIAQSPANSRAYLNQEPSYRKPMSISIREVLKDTLIKGLTFHKLKWLTFTDYEKEKTIEYRYEYFKDSHYILLNRALDTIHDFNVDRKQQQGIMFGKKGTVLRVGVKTIGTYMSEDRLSKDVETNDQAVRFYLAGAQSRYLQFDIFLREILESRDGKSAQVLLRGSEGVMSALHYREPFRAGYHLSKGDRVQFVLQGLGVDLETGKEGLVDTDILMYCYRGDTLIDGKKQLIITGVHYLIDGKYRTPFELLVRPVENGFYVNQHVFVRVPVLKPVFRLEIAEEYHAWKWNELRAELCMYDTLDGQVVPRYFRYKNPEELVFPLFPAFFPTYGAPVTYMEKDGKVYGKNRLPDENTDENALISITQEGNRLGLAVFTCTTGRIRVLLYDGKPSVVYDNQGELFPDREEKVLIYGRGWFHNLWLDLPALQPGKTYRLEIEFYHYGDRKAWSREFIADDE